MDLLLRCLRSGVWADPPVIASAPVAPIVVVAAKEARPSVVAEMVAMMKSVAAPKPITTSETMAAGHTTSVTTHATEVASAEAAAHATDVASGEAASMATTATKATSMPAATATGSHQDEWIACCIQGLRLLGAAKIARMCDRANSGKRKRKCAEKARRDWTVFHHCTPFACVLCKSRSPEHAQSPKRVVRAGAALKLRVDEGLEWQLRVHCILY